ncbi:uncharacterized protein LOC111391400 [Olea europaea var. sylvestris]|uniref:uncharacterized protein LOC111391400 n=1 Tax=Olea europaea var. sylvestris TaxID=158386 RepID=UPI000C1D37E0|nr:uncharacterized protein LOC111391400 [Olea europaea var. sylvestris]
MIVLKVMDLDIALWVDQPSSLTDKSISDDNKEMEKWKKIKSHKLNVIKYSIPETFWGTMSDKVTTAKSFFEDLDKKFAKNEKAETSTILAQVVSIRYKGKGNTWECIIEMS